MDYTWPYFLASKLVYMMMFRTKNGEMFLDYIEEVFKFLDKLYEIGNESEEICYPIFKCSGKLNYFNLNNSTRNSKF